MDTSTYNTNYPWEIVEGAAPTLWVLDNTPYSSTDVSVPLIVPVPLESSFTEYVIETPQELIWFIQNCGKSAATTKRARVIKDLDFAGTIWNMDDIPYLDGSTIILDFSGFTVSNVRVLNQKAMFSENEGIIKNLVLVNSGNYNSMAIGSQAMVVNENKGVVEHIQITADVINKHYNQQINGETLIVGGAVAQMNDSNTIVQKSYFTGNVTVQTEQLNTAYVGGLVGRTNSAELGLISQNYTNANIKVNATNTTRLNVGGLVGEIYNSNGLEVLDNYTRGTIEVPSGFTTANTYIAGVIGSFNANTSTSNTVERVYSVSTVTPKALNLGAIGNVTVANVAINVVTAYVLDTTVNTVNTTYNTTKNHSALIDKTILTSNAGTYKDWDFVDIWKYDNTDGYEYPVLQETENVHTINIIINFERGPFDYVYSEQNKYLINFFEKYGPPILNLHYINRVTGDYGWFSGITGVIRVDHEGDVIITSDAHTEETFMFLFEAMFDGESKDVTKTEFKVEEGIKDYTYEFSYRWNRYEVIVQSNDTVLGLAKIVRQNDLVNDADHGVDYSQPAFTGASEYIHGELIKLSTEPYSEGGLLKWQKQVAGETYVDITAFSESDDCIYIKAPEYSNCALVNAVYNEAAYQAALADAIANLKENEYIFDEKTFDLYFYVNGTTAGTYRAYYVRLHEFTFDVSSHDLGRISLQNDCITDIDPSWTPDQIENYVNNHEHKDCSYQRIISTINDIDGEAYYGISKIITYDGEGNKRVRYVEGAQIVIEPEVTNSYYKIDSVSYTSKVAPETIIYDTNGEPTSVEIGEKYTYEFSGRYSYRNNISNSSYYHQLATLTVLTVNASTAGDYVFNLELLEFKITVITSKGGSYTTQEGYTLTEEEGRVYYTVTGGETITFDISPSMRYAFVEFHLVTDVIEGLERPLDFVSRDYTDVITAPEDFELSDGNVYELEDVYTYALTGTNADMTLHLNYAQYTWYDYGKQDSVYFCDEATGIQTINATNYDGTTLNTAYILQDTSHFARLIYLANTNKSYTISGKTYYYKDAYYKVAYNNLNFETRFWSPIGGFAGTSFNGTMFSSTDDYRLTQVNTLKNIYMDPYEITLSNGVVISNLEEFETGVGFIGKSVNGYINNVNLENVQIVYEREDLRSIGSYIGYSDGARVYNAKLTSSLINVTGENNTGSIIGYADNGSGIYKVSSNTVITVDSTNSYVGGLVGINAGIVNASYFNGSIIVNTDNVVGGLVGSNLGLINMSYSNGIISTATDPSIVGTIAGHVNVRMGITDSYFIVGNLYDIDMQAYPAALEKPIGNMEDVTAFDVEIAKLSDGASTFKGFNFVNIYEASALGPTHVTPIFGSTTAELQGAGTKQNPYIIGTAPAFLTFINQINSCYEKGQEPEILDQRLTAYNNPNVYYLISANINLNGFDFRVIEEFNANLNGGGYTIEGLHIASAAEDNVAFININNGVVRDINFTKAVVVGKDNVAGVVVTNNGVMHGIVFDGIVMGRDNVAGVVTYNGLTTNRGTLVRLGSHGIVAGNTNVAGIVAHLINSNVDLYNDVFAFKYNADGSVICNYVGLTESYNRSQIVGNSKVGGLVAYANNSASHIAIKNVYNTGHIYANNKAAGIVGDATRIHIQFTYSYGDVVSFNNYVIKEDLTIAEMGHIVGSGNTVNVGYIVNSTEDKGSALIASDTRYLYLSKQKNQEEVVVFNDNVGVGKGVDCETYINAYIYEDLKVKDIFTGYDFDFINMWRYFYPKTEDHPEGDTNFNYGLPILKFFHSHLVTITINDAALGEFFVDEMYGQVNENGEIYILEGDDLVIDFDAELHYHIYNQIVDGEITKLELDEDPVTGVPDNTPKEYTYTFENVVTSHTIHINFTIDRYRFDISAICPQEEGNIGDVTLLYEDGTENLSGIYNYGDVVKLRINNLDHYKLTKLTHIRDGNVVTSTETFSYTLQSITQLYETDAEGNIVVDGNGDPVPVHNTFVYQHETDDEVYTIDEVRKLHTETIDGEYHELNYSTNEFVITFIANDNTANGTNPDAEGCAPAHGVYQAEFIKQYDLQVDIETWIDISIPQHSTEIGGSYINTIKANGLDVPILDLTGYGIIDHGTVVKLASTPAWGYNFIDYTDGLRPNHTVLSDSPIEEFEIVETRTIKINFELKGYIIKIILGPNGKLKLYTQNTVTGEFTPTLYTVPGTYEIEIRHGYRLKFDSIANETYAIDTIIASENKPAQTIEVDLGPAEDDPLRLTERYMEYLNVIDEFSVELTFRRQVWTDFPSESLSGSGTIEDPYLITNGHDWGLIANEVNLNGNTYEGKYFKVYPLDDEGNRLDYIDLIEYYFNPIGVAGDPAKQFKGTISGDFKTLTNIFIETIATQVGFFTEPDAVVTDLNFYNFDVLSTTSGAVVGGVAGHNLGTFRNIQTSGVLQGAGNIGGVVGINDGTLDKIKNKINVTGYGSYTGGIVGTNNAIISNSNNSGKVVGENTAEYVGGIAGITALNSTITKSANYAAISGKTSGGLVGNYARGTMTDVYNWGSVQGSNYAGGLFGYKNTSQDTSVKVTNAYNIGSVTGAQTGGVYGFLDETLTKDFSSVYYLSTNAGTLEQVGVTSKTITELRNIDTFTNYDFAETWGIKYYGTNSTDYHSGLPFIWTASTWDYWKETTTTIEADGTVTEFELLPDENGVYNITTAKELIWISNKVNSGELETAGVTFELKNDIDLFGHYFTPIGTSEHPFEGIFKGNNKIIYGLTIQNYYNTYCDNAVGLFGYINNAEISNLDMGLAHVVSNKQYAGAVVGYATNSTITLIDINLEDAKNAGIVKSLSTTPAYIGAIAGGIAGGKLDKSTTHINIEVNNGAGGGVVGSNAAVIDQVSSSANVVNNVANGIVGGIIGGNLGELTNAFFEGTLVTKAAALAAGGVVGNNTGLVKYTYANASKFTATGTVGGVIGVTSNYTTNEVTETDLVAYNYFNSAMGLNEKQGIGKAGSTNSSSFATTFYTNRAESKSSADLRKEATYINWDYDFIWAIDYTAVQLNEGYPLFYFNNDYQIIEVTVTHEDYYRDFTKHGDVFRRNYNRDGEQSSRVINDDNVTELVYVLTGNYVGFDVVPRTEGLIETVKVDGIEQVGAARELIEFGQTVNGHTIEVYFIRKKYEFTINGFIDAIEGQTVSPDTKITVIAKNMDTGTSYLIVLNNGETKKLYDITRGHYVLVINPPMFYEPTLHLIGRENEIVDTGVGKKLEFDLLPTSTDATINVTITKVNERWLNDSSHNYGQINPTEPNA